MECLEDALGEGDWTRLVVTSQGFDSRLLQAAKAACKVLQEALQTDTPSVGMVLQRRCMHLLREFPTTLEQDQKEMAEEGLNSNMLTAIRFRAGKKTILLTALSSFQ
eukprot:jgi/Botrbrau1/20425/Bobra.0694s0001.1